MENINKAATASGDELPPLPVAMVRIEQDDDSTWGEIQDEAWAEDGSTELMINAPLFTTGQMQGYARAAVSAATKPTADLSSFDADHFKQLLRDVSNESYFCGIHLDNDEAYAGHLALAEAADKAIIDYVQSLLATKPAAAPAVPEGGKDE